MDNSDIQKCRNESHTNEDSLLEENIFQCTFDYKTSLVNIENLCQMQNKCSLFSRKLITGCNLFAERFV